jgi:hypothetical protein
MAFFSTTPTTAAFIDEMLKPASYADAASYPPRAASAPTGLQHHRGYDGSISSVTMQTTPGTSIATEIAQLKTTIATLQNTSTTTSNNDNTTTSATPNIMQMFQQLHQGMLDSKSEMTNFRNSLESKVHAMEFNIQEIQQEHKKSNTTATNFQADVNLALRELRTENNELHSRIDRLAQKPSASPRRKKLKDAHKSAALPTTVTAPPPPEAATNTVTFQLPPPTDESDAPTVSFPNPNEDSDVDTADDSDPDELMLLDNPTLADHDDDDPLNETNAMQTDPAYPDEDS